tara:strand:- start:9856 stop:10365 length:510 start_codon:yes stop_codon:yes gene_type:complete
MNSFLADKYSSKKVPSSTLVMGCQLITLDMRGESNHQMYIYASNGGAMHYEITSQNSTATIRFEGLITALDLIFMIQDSKYRQALKNNRNLFWDFSRISGSQLTAEDRQGLALLGKRDAEQVSDRHLVILSAFAESEGVGLLLKDIFVKSSWQVTVVQTEAEARKLLQT